MPEERVYFPAGILPARLGIDFPTVRDRVSFRCLSGLLIPWKGRGLILWGRTLCCTDDSWSVSSEVASVSWLTLFPLNGPRRRRFYAGLCVAHRGNRANKPDETSCLLICAASSQQIREVFASAAVTSWFGGVIHKGVLDIWCVSTLESITVMQWLCLVAGEHSKLYVDC